MPRRPPKPCSHAGCGLVTYDRYCGQHRAQADQQQHEQRRQHDQQRGSAASRGYGPRWRKARKGYLAHHPLCVDCQSEGRTTPSTVVDHIEPHKGDMTKFWDHNNWQPLCKSHHDSKTARADGGWGRGG